MDYLSFGLAQIIYLQSGILGISGGEFIVLRPCPTTEFRIVVNVTDSPFKCANRQWWMKYSDLFDFIQSIRVLTTMFKYLCFGQNIVQKYFHQNIPKVPEVKVLNHCMIIIIFIIIICASLTALILQLVKAVVILTTSCITYHVNLKIKLSQFKWQLLQRVKTTKQIFPLES